MKPIVQELGPYVFKGRWYKENMEWNEEVGTVTYKDVKDYTFVPELSVGSQEDEIYSLNAPLLAVVNYVEDYAPFFLRSFIVEMMNGIFESYNETLLVRRTIRQLIYEGYHEPMVADLTKVVEPFITLPLKLLNDTFGILHERKHLGDGVFQIKSGAQGIHDYATIEQWNNQSVVDWWSDDQSDECNRIGGTDGVQYAPGVTRNTTLKMFNPNLCRVLSLQYERDVTVHGIKTLRFGFPENALTSHKCYCQGPQCYAGILPLNCKKGAPYVISFPHFLEGDASLQTSVTGVKSVTQKHKTYVDIEPFTGFALNAAFRMQLNGVTRPFPEYKLLENITTETIVPVLWMSEEAQLDVSFATYFKKRVQTPMVMFRVLCLTAVAMGAFTALAATTFGLCIHAKVRPETLKQSLVLKTLNSVYTSVALWPLPEEELKNVTEKTHL